jgi:sugar/nucleoside kinase (ribokinase family)
MKRMPMVGETFSAEDNIFKAFGGKGANQAIACARLNRHHNKNKPDHKNKIESI